MKLSRVIVAVLVVALVLGAGAAAFIGVRKVMADSKYEAAAKEELARQQPEVDACRKQLLQLLGAWKKYRSEHKGTEPPSIDVLLTRYVAEPELFVCPTARRLLDAKQGISGGSFKFKDKTYTETYSLRWLVPVAYARDLKFSGEKAPVIACPVHREALYRAAYRKAPSIGAFDEGERGNLVPTVRTAGIYTVRRDGTSDTLKPDEE